MVMEKFVDHFMNLELPDGESNFNPVVFFEDVSRVTTYVIAVMS